MGQRHIRNRLDFYYLQDSKVGLPLMESIQRVVIRAKAFRQSRTSNRPCEHPAQRHAIHDAAVDAKANDAARKLMHHDQYPMRSQRGGLAAEQVAPPQAVFGVAEKGEPGRAAVRSRPVVRAQDTANHIFVYLYSKSQRDLLRDSGTAPTRIPSFHFRDCIDQLSGWSLRAGMTSAIR